jgi:hypothetical protein
VQIANAESWAPVFRGDNVDGAARNTWAMPFRAGPRGFEEMNLLDRHRVGRDLKPQRAGIEAAWGMGEAGIHVDLFGAGGNLARGEFERAGAIACVAGDAVESFAFDRRRGWHRDRPARSDRR